MLMATVLTLDRAYTVLGLVMANKKSMNGLTQPEEALQELEKEAKKMGADAVIGIQFITGTALAMMANKAVATWAIGTAVKFT